MWSEFVVLWRYDCFPFVSRFLFMLGCAYCSGSSVRASQPFPLMETWTGCFSLSRRRNRWLSVLIAGFSRSRSLFSIYFLPLLPPFSSASPLLRPYCLSRCLPKVARPNVAGLCWWMLWIIGTLLSLGTLLTTSGRVFIITSSLLLSLVLVCSLFSSIPQKRSAKRDQPVAYCPARLPMLFSSSQIPRLGSILSILWSLHDCFPPFSLSHTGLISLWHIVRLVSRFSPLPSSSSLPPPYLYPILPQSSLAPHQVSWYFVKSPPS